MNDDNIRNPLPDDMSQRAVSLYGQGGDALDDFPVLRAFQQYVNAEQDKARKRLVSLGIVFGVVLLVMLAMFMFMFHELSMRNQAQNDRNQAQMDKLIEYYAMRGDSRQSAVPTTVVQAAPAADSRNDESIRALTSAITDMQKKLDRPIEAVTMRQPTAAELEHERKVREDTAKLERAKALIDKQKRELEKERQRLHEIEVDRQRRKLYPESYVHENTGTAQRPAATTRTTSAATRAKPQATQRPTKAEQVSDKDVEDILREAYPDGVKDDDEPMDSLEDDAYNVSVGVKDTGSRIHFTLPID